MAMANDGSLTAQLVEKLGQMFQLQVQSNLHFEELRRTHEEFQKRSAATIEALERRIRILEESRGTQPAELPQNASIKNNPKILESTKKDKRNRVLNNEQTVIRTSILASSLFLTYSFSIRGSEDRFVQSIRNTLTAYHRWRFADRSLVVCSISSKTTQRRRYQWKSARHRSTTGSMTICGTRLALQIQRRNALAENEYGICILVVVSKAELLIRLSFFFSSESCWWMDTPNERAKFSQRTSR